MKEINQWSRSELLLLPVRDWQTPSDYRSVLILNTRKKHDSGWSIVAIIGVEKEPVEIAAMCCDDIEWNIRNMRMDCALKSGAMHVWKTGSRFRVGEALSSVTIAEF